MGAALKFHKIGMYVSIACIWNDVDEGTFL